MKKFWFFSFMLVFTLQISAQYTDIINSRRPGSSESPYGVGTDVFQLETGFFYGQSESDATFAKIDPMGVKMFLRYGNFSEKLEFNANVTYQKNELQFNNIFTSSKDISGISELTIGAKYMIFQQEYEDKSKEIRSWKRRTEFDNKRWIPTVGVYLGLNTNFLSEDYKSSGMSPKAAILLQNDFSSQLNLITNFIADKIATDYSVYSYVATVTYAIDSLWSFFIENQGDFTKYRNEFYLGAGTAYLYSRNLQFDISIRSNLNSVNSEFIAGLGVSWRLDRHQDELINTNQGNKRRNGNKGFFSRLFNK